VVEDYIASQGTVSVPDNTNVVVVE
jgi:hypothetical protein